MGRRQIGQEVMGFARAERRSGLDDLAAAIDWAPLEARLGAISPPGRGEQGWPPLALLKALLIGFWYDLSDVKLAEALDDRASFRRFCGFSGSEATPERTAFVRFRRELVRLRLEKPLFNEVVRQLDAAGGAVAAQIDEVGRDLERRRRRRVIADAQRGIALGKHLEDGRLVPARMAELECASPLRRQKLQKCGEPFAVGVKLRRQLKQDRPEAFAERVHPPEYEPDRVLGVLQPPVMRDVARCLPGENEPAWNGVPPARHGLDRRQPVEAGIDLGRPETAGVIGQLVADTHAVGIERPPPGIVMPA